MAFFVIINIMTDIVALVLAGGENDKLAQSQAVKHKADIIVNGKPLFEPVLRSLKTDNIVHKIYIGDLDPQYSNLADTIVKAGNSFVESLSIGFAEAKKLNANNILVITADLPFLTKSVIESFIDNAPDADLIYPIINKQTSLEQFPNQKRTYAKFIEGSFTGGNAILLKFSTIPKLLSFADKAYKARKSPLRLAFLIGFDVFISLIIGNSKLSKLEKRVSKLLNANVKTYNCQDASLGADIDKLEHLQNIN